MKFLVRKTPDNFIKSVNDEINSILNRHFNSYYPDYDYENETDNMIMPVEVRDKTNEYDIRAELPGVKKEDLDISLNDGYLTITATKTEEKNEDELIRRVKTLSQENKTALLQIVKNLK